jgi:tRNA(Ile)-lysidine synthase
MSAVLEAIQEALERSGVQQCEMCVALSGGIDSVSLLDALWRIAPERGLALSALHVNHGLSPRAAQWQAFCREWCSGKGIALTCETVEVDRDAGLGLEAAARRARYAAFERVQAQYLALAHHLDDQIETLLIQLLRGAGARGLGAMPVLARLEGARQRGGDTGPRILRPLLTVTRAQIEEYARQRALEWVEDESNCDVALERNFLRQEVLPLIASRFPGYRETLARSAQNLADAAALAEALAQIDLQSVRDGEGLSARALGRLPRERALNVLRHAFALRSLPMPPRARLEEALRQCLESAPDARVQVRFDAVSIRRHRDRIVLVEGCGEPLEWEGLWRGEDTLLLPGGLGCMRFVPTTGDGISRARLDSAPVSVRFRRGGEKLSLGHGRPRRDLKRLLQEAGVPYWERTRLPLLFCGEVLAWVPGIGVSAECVAREDEAAIRVEWEPAGAQNPAC